MSTYEDNLLAARFAALAPEPLAGDWADVVGRAGVARKGRRLLRRSDRPWSRRRLVVALAVAALVVAVGTASAFGIRAFFLDQGFIGLPPEGATPSAPERGKLVLSFVGRPTILGFPLYRVWVYSDGRLIWDREGYPPVGASLERLPFRASERTTGFLEQRLTPEGVELLLSEIISTGLFGHDLALVSGHGHHWGAIQVRNGDRLVEVEWDTPTFLSWRENEDRARFRDATPEQASALERLSARLTDPASWLPASAWEDREIRAYVPSQYAVCFEGGPYSIEPSDILALLPGPAEDLLRAKGIRHGEGSVGCYDVTTGEARAIAEALNDAGLERNDPDIWQAYRIQVPGPIRKEGLIVFLAILPHGEVICSHCG